MGTFYISKVIEVGYKDNEEDQVLMDEGDFKFAESLVRTMVMVGERVQGIKLLHNFLEREENCKVSIALARELFNYIQETQI